MLADEVKRSKARVQATVMAKRCLVRLQKGQLSRYWLHWRSYSQMILLASRASDQVAEAIRRRSQQLVKGAFSRLLRVSLVDAWHIWRALVADILAASQRQVSAAATRQRALQFTKHSLARWIRSNLSKGVVTLAALCRGFAPCSCCYRHRHCCFTALC